MITASQAAMQALSVSRTLMLLVPCMLAVCIALFLLKGRVAPEVRNRVTIFTGAWVIGMFLCTLWLALNLSPEALCGTAITYSGALLTRHVLWMIGAVCGALMLHALVYLLSSMRALPGLLRNRTACVLIVVAIATALWTIVPQARYWRCFYNADNFRSVIETARCHYNDTDSLTRDWVARSPDDWHALLLRAHFLRDAGRAAEAGRLHAAILTLPEEDVPDSLRRACEGFLR
ncbi:MAG: hypothetical protein JXB04_11370 [Kiritimatiellae bacterium]|nr:hypothetical protein [Kiritimatiellia bacterium]